jgi:cell wall-associated NlpC family hydrolase
MLSAAAIAAMTGSPVLAEEAASESLFLTNTLENDQDQEVGNSGTVEQFLGGTLNSEEDGEEDKAFDAAETAEAQESEPEVMIPMAAAAEETEEEASDYPYADAVQEYNAAVLPELTVSLAKSSSVSSVLEEQVAVEAPAFESEANSAPALQDTAEEKKIVVASPNVYLNIHAEPAMSSEVLGKMYSNDLAIELRKEDDRWTKIRSGNVVGYVMNEYLVDGSEAAALSEIVSTQVATVNEKADCSIYQDSDDYSKVISEAKAGDQYEVTGSEDGWIGILTDTGEGFIPASEVTLSMAYPVAESSREEVNRVSNSNVKERADHEQRKADKAEAVVELAQTRAGVAGFEDEETATAVVEVALRAADAAAAQADVAQVAVSQAGEESGQAVIEFATQFIGNPYVWGGSSLTHGADCSGFVMAVYGNFGFRLPHYDVSDRSVGSPVASLDEARAGDIVCYNGHVALYMGDGMIVHAQDERHGITTSKANFMHIVCIRRLFN